MVRHGTLDPARAGSSPASPATFLGHRKALRGFLFCAPLKNPSGAAENLQDASGRNTTIPDSPNHGADSARPQKRQGGKGSWTGRSITGHDRQRGLSAIDYRDPVNASASSRTNRRCPALKPGQAMATARNSASIGNARAFFPFDTSWRVRSTMVSTYPNTTVVKSMSSEFAILHPRRFLGRIVLQTQCHPQEPHSQSGRETGGGASCIISAVRCHPGNPRASQFSTRAGQRTECDHVVPWAMTPTAATAAAISAGHHSALRGA